CAERRRAEGVDVTAYTTEASADDLDDLRAALGAARLNLFGFSYGTHLALTAMRRHGDRLGRIVLAGTEGPDHTYKLPSVLDRQIDTVAALAARDPAVASDVPDMAGLLRQILQRLGREPRKLTIANMRGAERTITVGAWGFLYLLRRDIGDTNDLPGFPRLLHQIARGELDALTRLAERRFTQLASGTPLMPIAMDCASGVSAARAAQIAAETRSSTFGVMTNYPFPEVCDTLGLKPLGDEFRAPLVSRLPVLFISGTLDANTPPHQAEEIRRGLPLATHIIVEGAGHESTLPLPEVEQAILDFLGGKDVRGRHLQIPLKFTPVR
ncbi:MAG: alpha/beta hydrolase, partial [Vicinamibacterales bacterium]